MSFSQQIGLLHYEGHHCSERSFRQAVVKWRYRKLAQSRAKTSFRKCRLSTSAPDAISTRKRQSPHYWFTRGTLPIKATARSSEDPVCLFRKADRTA